MKSYLKIIILLLSIFIISGAQMAFACGGCPPPPPCHPPSECRVTGGGLDIDDPSWDGTMAWGQFKKSNDGSWNRYTFGGQAGAPTASQPQPYGEWTHHQQSGPYGSFVFHAGTASAPEGTEIDLVVCSDPGTCTPSGDPPSPNKQIDFEGVGSFRNIKSDLIEANFDNLHWFEVHIEDLGEPGKSGKQNHPNNGRFDLLCPPEGSAATLANCECPDFYRITIYEEIDGGEVLYEVYGYITGGNLQMHYPVK